MKIHDPIFSGSIKQSDESYAELSGSFTGSFRGNLVGEITVEQATFDDLVVNRTITVGTFADDKQLFTGSLLLSGSIEVDGNVNVVNNGQIQVDGVNVLDSAIAFAIALG